MKLSFRNILALFLSTQLVFLEAGLAGCADRRVSAAPPAAQAGPLRDYLQKSYLELFELAPKMEFSAPDIETQRKSLEDGKHFCVARFKDHARQYEKQAEAAQKDLKQKTAGMSESERKQVHCRIQNLELLKSEAEVLSGHAIPTAYDNLGAKLELIEKWPAVFRQTRQEIADGSHLRRRGGDVKDIGFREIAAGQEDDIKKGQQSIEELKRAGLIPPELE